MTRKDLKEIISSVITKLQQGSPATACGVLYADDTPTTRYAVGEEDPTTKYAMGEEDPVKPTPTPILRYSIREKD